MKPLFKVLSTILTLGIVFIFSLPCHEYFHYIALRALGGDGYIDFPEIIGGYTHFTVPPPHHEWVVFLSGGLGVALLCAIFWLLAKKTPTLWDLDIEAVFAIMGSFQLGYGISEIPLAWDNTALFDWLSVVLIIVFTLPPVLYYLPKLARWFLERG